MTKGAWWVPDPSAVTTLAAAGFSVYIIPDIDDAQIDATLDAVPNGHYAIVILQGEPAHKEACVRRLAGRNFFGYVVHDEPNVGGTLLMTSVQRDYYQAVKRIDPWKQVIASYHLEPDGPSFPDYVVMTPGLAWDYVMLNYYPATWGVSDEQAAVNLRVALRAASDFFPPAAKSLILSCQQAAGVRQQPPRYDGWDSTVFLRPIPGLLQAQQDIWAASGLNPIATIWYGWGTSPEDWNLHNPSALAEAAAVR